MTWHTFTVDLDKIKDIKEKGWIKVVSIVNESATGNMLDYKVGLRKYSGKYKRIGKDYLLTRQLNKDATAKFALLVPDVKKGIVPPNDVQVVLNCKAADKTGQPIKGKQPFIFKFDIHIETKGPESNKVYDDLKKALKDLERSEKKLGNAKIFWTDEKYYKPLARIWKDFQTLTARKDAHFLHDVVESNPKYYNQVNFILYYILQRAYGRKKGRKEIEKVLGKKAEKLSAKPEDERWKNYTYKQVIEALEWLIGHLEKSHS